MDGGGCQGWRQCLVSRECGVIGYFQRAMALMMWMGDSVFTSTIIITTTTSPQAKNHALLPQDSSPDRVLTAS